MDDSLYDEFGNYIGGGSSSGSESNDEEEEWMKELPEVQQEEEEAPVEQTGVTAIVLHEDKKYYPDAEEVFPEAETLVMEEDEQAIEEPIIQPVKVRAFTLTMKKIPELTFSPDFLAGLMKHPSLTRNIAIIGQLHHGKTEFCDLLVRSTWAKEDAHPEVALRFTDTRKSELERGISIRATPLSVVLPDIRDKSYLLNVMDTPGHPNFSDDVTASLRAVDGVVLVVDVIEGLLTHTERMIEQAVLKRLPMVLVVNKMDRLIVELKLPPEDAYRKIFHVIGGVNACLKKCSHGFPICLFSPTAGNVAFSSTQMRWSFTLESFAMRYTSLHQNMNPSGLAKRLWGDAWFDKSARRFVKKQPEDGSDRTFVQFVLNPLYKAYSTVLGESEDAIARLASELGIRVRPRELRVDVRPLLNRFMERWLGSPAGFVSMVVKFLPSPELAGAIKVEDYYMGDQSGPVVDAMRECDKDGPLMVQIVKQIESTDAETFMAFGRVLSGTLKTGQKVKVMGETYTDDDEEDMDRCEVKGIAVGCGRYRIDVTEAPAGSLVLIDGIDRIIVRTATVCEDPSIMMEPLECSIFRPLRFMTEPAVKMAIEPLIPSELPKIMSGLKKICKCYPLVQTRVEESGEHVILATGELAVDCLMYDLREVFGNVEVKVADPVTPFRETVMETSAVRCFAETVNKANKFTMIAEPMDKGLAECIEKNEILLGWDKRKVQNFFQTKFEWDVLAARSVWAFGPESNGPNVLCDDTLSADIDKSLLGQVKDYMVQGFQWACREGPLCDEPIRNCRFKILDAVVSSDRIERGGGQVIPTTRRVAYSSFLTATPRLMEPWYYVETVCPADCVAAVYTVLQARRGHVVQDDPLPGTPWYTVMGYIPVIDSFGFETDLRVHTQGMAMCTQMFDHWGMVPGDPLEECVLRPLEPAPPQHLAREFMVKTRRRKGLGDDVAVSKYFDDPLLLELARKEASMEL